MMIFKRESRRFLFVSLSSIGLFCSERRAVYSTVPCFVRHTRRRAVDEKRCRTEGRTWSLWLDSETASLGESDWICKVLLLIRRKGDYVCRYTCKVVMSLCLSNPIFSLHCSSPIQVLFFTLSKTFPGDKCVVSLISSLLQDFMQKDYFETFFFSHFYPDLTQDILSQRHLMTIWRHFMFPVIFEVDSICFIWKSMHKVCDCNSIFQVTCTPSCLLYVVFLCSVAWKRWQWIWLDSHRREWCVLSCRLCLSSVKY